MSGKRNKIDVQEFSLSLMENILDLHRDLRERTYSHGPYQAFRINDPKPRQIHKSLVRDRLLHHAVYQKLYPFFDKTFITDSYSCRLEKGTHRAMNRFRKFAWKESRNHTRTVWVLKCDIRKFFENINHSILINIFKKYIPYTDIIWLLQNIIQSFSVVEDRGLPLGNLTSQLFVNIYMNEFDQWMKHHMKTKYYVRYADDFVVMSHNKEWLEELLPKIGEFLDDQLKLQLHSDKISVSTLASGVDFLGWVHFPNHRVLRTATKRRMIKKLSKSSSDERLNSYLGLLSHGNAQKLKLRIKKKA
ncbi:MAG: reverse transcriptase/maturase family protein [Patescibacteria group bacterium]